MTESSAQLRCKYPCATLKANPLKSPKLWICFADSAGAGVSRGFTYCTITKPSSVSGFGVQGSGFGVVVCSEVSGLGLGLGLSAKSLDHFCSVPQALRSAPALAAATA